MKVTRSISIVTTGTLSVSVSVSPKEGYVGHSVKLSASWDGIAVGPFHVHINWGDGKYTSFDTSSKSFTRNHTYGSSGSYTIKVTVSDEYTAAEGSASTSVTIKPELSASLSASPTSGKVPLKVTFTFYASGGYKPYSWKLDFGDGSSPASGSGWDGSSKSVSHTYNKIGKFTATLTVADAKSTLAVSLAEVMAGVAKAPIPAVMAVVGGIALIAVSGWVR